MSFAELEALAARRAAGLAGRSVGPGDRVAIACHNDIAFVATYLGALWAGAVAVPLNPQAPPAVLAAQAERVGARLIVCGPGTEELLGLAGAVSEPDLAAAEPMAAEVERDDDELAVLLFTSGTAGAPRAAMLTHGNLAANIGQVQDHPGLRVDPDDVGLARAPVLPRVRPERRRSASRLHAGMTTILVDHFDAARAAELIRVRRVTIVAGVPTMFGAFLELPDELASPVTFASVRLAVSGAAELSVERAEEFRDPVRHHDPRGLRPHRGRADREHDRGRGRAALGFDRPSAAGDRRPSGRRRRRGRDGGRPGRDLGAGPERLRRLLGRPRGDRAGPGRRLAAHRRRRGRRRRRLPQPGRPQEGPGHRLGLQRLPGRGGGGPARPPRHRRRGGDRHAASAHG